MLFRSDEEIVKVLNECFAEEGRLRCADCGMFTGNGLRSCMKNVAVNALDLIHRLQAEKAEYERKIDDGEFVSKDWHDEQVGHAELVMEEQKAEIERLKRLVKKPEVARLNGSVVLSKNEWLDMQSKLLLADDREKQSVKDTAE